MIIHDFENIHLLNFETNTNNNLNSIFVTIDYAERRIQLRNQYTNKLNQWYI